LASDICNRLPINFFSGKISILGVILNYLLNGFF
jgi:hypothetical protein